MRIPDNKKERIIERFTKLRLLDRDEYDELVSTSV